MQTFVVGLWASLALLLNFASSVGALSASEVSLAEWESIQNDLALNAWAKALTQYQTSQLRKMASPTADAAILGAMQKTSPYDKLNDGTRVLFIKDVVVLGLLREAVFRQAHDPASACDQAAWSKAGTMYTSTVGAVSSSICVDFGTCLTPPGGSGATTVTNELVSAAIQGGSRLMQDRLQAGSGYCQSANAVRTMQDLSWLIRQKSAGAAVQWLIRYAYRADPTTGFSTLADQDQLNRNWARAYAGYVAVEADIKRCSPHVDRVLAENLDLKNSQPVPRGNMHLANHVEHILPCLHVACSEVGNNTRYMPPCRYNYGASEIQRVVDERNAYREATIALGVILGLFLLVCLVVLVKRRCAARQQEQQEQASVPIAKENELATQKSVHNSQRWENGNGAAAGEPQSVVAV